MDLEKGPLRESGCLRFLEGVLVLIDVHCSGRRGRSAGRGVALCRAVHDAVLQAVALHRVLRDRLNLTIVAAYGTVRGGQCKLCGLYCIIHW